ncbi:MAG: S-layer homology domain-containing protein [Candidatus Margulisiibacteriota bacterium]
MVIAGPVKADTKTNVTVPQRKVFTDVPWGYWAKGSIELLGGLGVIRGYPDGSFHPEGTITRAEFTMLMVKAKSGRLNNLGLKSFPDIPTGHWAAAYIDKAVETELIKGYPNNTFRPNKKVSRVEGVSALARFDNLPIEEAEALPFPDILLSHWAAESISAAKKAGLLDYLASQNFNAKKPLTRAEAVHLLAKTSFFNAKL